MKALIALLALALSFYAQPSFARGSSTDAIQAEAPGGIRIYQELATSGARDLEIFTLGKTMYLAIPQMATDIPGSKAGMNGGDSDTDIIIYSWRKNTFCQYQRIPSHGNEDLEFFQIGKRSFLAVACIRSGNGPYNLNCSSMIYEWDGKKFYPFQQIRVFAAKGCKHFTINDKHYLAVAGGLKEAENDVINKQNANATLQTSSSLLYEWKDGAFAQLQRFETPWAYSFEAFALDGKQYLGLCDNILGSRLYLWNGRQFEPFQSFNESGARHMSFLNLADNSFLAIANLLSNSGLYKWNGKTFEKYQEFSGKGGHRFAFDGKRRLARINFIIGERGDPKVELKSQLYCWKNDRFELEAEFDTSGGTAAAFFLHKGKEFMAVSNSLSRELRFRVNSSIYLFDEKSTATRKKSVTQEKGKR